MAKTTLDKLSYRDAPLRASGMIVKAFEGSRKSVIGEADLPITVGPHEFQITSGEEALLVSHLSAFSYISADDTDDTSFQGLSVEGEGSKKVETSMASLKDALRVLQEGVAPRWGQLVQLPVNK
jgi:hypothetical protein